MHSTHRYESSLNQECVNTFDAVNMAYLDRIKYKTAIGNIRNTVMTDHTLFTFPAAKAFASGKILICEMWIERMTDEWIVTLSPMLATAWPGFHKFSSSPSLMTLFTGFLASDWTRTFLLDYIEQPWVNLNDYNHNVKENIYFKQVALWI